MKKIFFLTVFVLSTLTFTSCVTSVHPLATYRTATTDQRITGLWTSDEQLIVIEPFLQSNFGKELQRSLGKENKPFVITGDASKDSILFNRMYLYSTTQNNITYYMAGGLVKLGNDLFAELYPLHVQDSRHEDPLAFHNNFLPSFTVAKLEWSGNGQMTMKFINGDFIAEQVRRGRVRLKHEKNELFGTFTITAPSEELQLFLEKYGNDERMFSKDQTVVLKRKPVT